MVTTLPHDHKLFQMNILGSLQTYPIATGPCKKNTSLIPLVLYIGQSGTKLLWVSI